MAGFDTESLQPSSDRAMFLCCWCEVVFCNGGRAVGQAGNYGICPKCLDAALAELAANSPGSNRLSGDLRAMRSRRAVRCGIAAAALAWLPIAGAAAESAEDAGIGLRPAVSAPPPGVTAAAGAAAASGAASRSVEPAPERIREWMLPDVRSGETGASLAWTRPDAAGPGVPQRVEIVADPEATDAAGAWYEVHYTIDPELDAAVREVLARKQVPLGHVILMDPASGEIFAYVSTDPEEFPATRAYPTASLMKVVTAAAVLEKAPEAARRGCRTQGNPYRLVPSQLDPAGEIAGGSESFWRALAISNNQCFAQFAVHDVGEDELLAEIERTRIFEAPGAQHDSGRVEPVGDALELGMLGSGLAGSFVTPLGAARLAALIATGERVKPYWIEAVRDARGDPLAVPGRRPPERVWSPEVTAELRALLTRVTSEGTARRGFHDAGGRPRLGPVRVAGKTGTLSGTRPPGRYQWFIGVAPADAPRIAIATIVVQDRPGARSASEIAASSLEAVFCGEDGCRAEGVSRLHERAAARRARSLAAVRDAVELDAMPRPVAGVGFDFPRRLLRKKVQGRIVLKVMLDPAGQVLDVAVADSDLPDFEEFVAGEVRSWQFTPPRYHGRPVFAEARLPIPITIE